jgi:fatty acid desaturase
MKQGTQSFKGVVSPEDLGWTEAELSVDGVREQLQDALKKGGLEGKALKVGNYWPTKKEVFAAIPDDCFKKETGKSLMYAAISVAQIAACVYAGSFIPFTAAAWPMWVAYACVTGTFMTGAWVIAHECGHDAFCNEKWLQTAVGYVLHSAMLAPYFSWQRSHAVHHAKTNHISDGETHVPKIGVKPRIWEKMAKFMSMPVVAFLRVAVRLGLGWPAYLIFGASGGPAYGKPTSHFLPYAVGAKKDLFPGKWKAKVWQSDIGCVIVCAGLWKLAQVIPGGWAGVMAIYGGPLCVANAWLVLYTWLQHTDVDIPHYDTGDWNFAKGCFSTVDRPYGPVFDWIHHRIGSTHVAHHVNCTIPHYKAQKATDALKKAFPDLYLYDPTPVPLALWRVVANCFRVKKVPGPEGMHVFALN